MYYSESRYLSVVVDGLDCKFNGGWPREIPFMNPSDLKGGVLPLRRLLSLWKTGVLRIVRVTDEDRRRAQHDRRTLLPNPSLPTRDKSKSSNKHKPHVVPLVFHPVDFHELSRPPGTKSAHSDALIACTPAKRPREQHGDFNRPRCRRVTGRRPRPGHRGVISPQYVYEAASDAEEDIESDGEEPEREYKRLRVALSDDYIEEYTDRVEAEAESDDESIESDTESWLERTA